MADFLDRLVTRSRVPTPAPRGLGRSLAIEDDVVVAPSRPAPAPVASPAAVTAPLPGPAAAAPSPTRKAQVSPDEPAPAVVRVEVAAPEAVEVVVARPAAEPAADAIGVAVGVAPPGPASSPPDRESLVSALPRPDTVSHPVASERRVVERLVEARTDLRTEAVVESRTERVSVVAPQVARPIAVTRPRPSVPPPVAVSADPAPPAVHIHIGRLDVRSADEPTAAAPAGPAPTGPTPSILSLGDYLRGRAGAQS